jgi:cell division protein FtsZ
MNTALSDEFQTFDQHAVIKVCGIGGGGGNAIGRMIQGGISEVEFITINTDAQALRNSPAGTRLQIGVKLTGGLGSGAKPEVGFQAAEEDRERIREVLGGADMVFLTAGLGGGTGTGATPIVAEEARATGALTIAIVTLPFSFEGKERFANALKGLAELEKFVDTLIVVPNDRVAQLSHEGMSFLSAFTMADDVLANGVRAISELITVPGLINLDFADVRTIMQARGRALMGIGMGEGDERAVRAAEEAIVCPLLDQSNINGAMGVIVNIKGGCDIRMREIQNAVSVVKKSAHPDANIIFGAVIEETERPDIQVTVIAAGFPKSVSESFPMPEFAAGAAPKPAPVPAPKPAPAPVQVAPAPKPAPAPAPAPVSTQVTAPAPAPKPVHQSPPELKPTSSPAVKASEPSPKTGTPEEQYLFPKEDTPSKEDQPASEQERDMGIPTFLWKRMQKRKP